MHCTQYDRLFQQQLSRVPCVTRKRLFSHKFYVCSWLRSKNITNFRLAAAAILKSNMADTEVRFSVAQYLKIFVPYIWTSVPNLVLLSKSAQLVGLAAPLLLVINSNCGSILQRFRDTATYCLYNALHSSIVQIIKLLGPVCRMSVCRVSGTCHH